MTCTLSATAEGDGYNVEVEGFREEEYPMLRDEVYLDHAGTTLYGRSLVERFSADMMTNLLGNPHSASSSSQAAAQMVEDVRLRTLQFFGADPDEFDLVFVANATAGIKLVTEAFRGRPGGFDYAYHQASHTSLVGVREEALSAACLSSVDMEEWVSGRRPASIANSADDADGPRATLVAYPAQSNMDGRRLPLGWARDVRMADSSVCTLLDAAAYASTSCLRLGSADTAPDFTVVSFYKIFGFPDLGGLLVRRQAESLFGHRRYFGGGTVDVVVCSAKEQWHAIKSQSLHDRLEDGTLPVHSILALGAAMQTHTALYGSMDRVAAHTGFLANRLYAKLDGLRHKNGSRVCAIYSPPRLPGSGRARSEYGPVLAFNLQTSQGAWVSLTEFDKLASLKKFHVRTGGVCNPGGVASALGLEPWEMRRNFSHGLKCGSENEDDVVSGKPTGIIRVSLGAMSTVSDVDRFVAFVDEFYREHVLAPRTVRPPPSWPTPDGLFVSSISVYPIKSCGAFAVPPNTPWEVRPEGLAWDREWCLVHQGTRRALSQKQYPKMALLRPHLDFEAGVLRVTMAGQSGHVSVPLSHNPALFSAATTTTTTPSTARASRVCGEDIAAQVYTSNSVNAFFSDALGVSCLLARFPPGGQGKSMRHAKAHLQKHQPLYQKPSTGHPPSPPDSDSERTTRSVSGTGEAGSSEPGRPRRILLSNESPILAINMASLRALNKEVRSRQAQAISPLVFRANLVLDSTGAGAPYAEDDWSRLRIGQQAFTMLGSCRRCHMVCIDQDTGAKSEEPFVTLTKTRRFDGKVFFGTHMGHEESNESTREGQFPTIAVGDAVAAEYE